MQHTKLCAMLDVDSSCLFIHQPRLILYKYVVKKLTQNVKKVEDGDFQDNKMLTAFRNDTKGAYPASMKKKRKKDQN